MSMNPQSFVWESVPGITLVPTQTLKRISLAQSSEKRPGWWTVIVQAAEVFQDNADPRAVVPALSLARDPAGSSVYLAITSTGPVGLSCGSRRAGFEVVTDCCSGRWSVWGDSIDLQVAGVSLFRSTPGSPTRSSVPNTAYTLTVSTLYYQGCDAPVGDRHARVTGRVFVPKGAGFLEFPIPAWSTDVQVSTPAAGAASISILDQFGPLASFPVVAGSSAPFRLPSFATAIRLPEIGGADTRYSLSWGQEWW